MDEGKRDFLKLVAGAGAAIGVGAIAWPLIDSMNPSADVLALSSVEVDLTPIAGRPGHHRRSGAASRSSCATARAKEIKEAEDVKLSDLIEPQAGCRRASRPGHEQWIVLIGICTHLGCIPLGNKPTDPRGDWGGWFCPCHGSQYDTSGRVRHGPAPLNLALPPYAFETDTKIKIG